MKILIVEDEIKTGEYLSKGLTEAGFVVDHADNGLTGYHLAMTAEYDLVILDIMLPDVNGWDIIRMLRSAGKGMPVLLLTALGTIEHRVKGLELGADDYLVKPFAFAELLARVRTLLRRGNTMITESQLKVADLSVDLVSRKVGTVAKLAMRQPFVLFKGLTFQKLCLPGAFRPGDHHNKMLRPGLCVVHASPQYL